MLDHFSFTEAERLKLMGLDAIRLDAQGRELLAGLTFDETWLYMSYLRASPLGHSSSTGRKTYLELHKKYEFERQLALGLVVPPPKTYFVEIDS